MAEKKVAHSVVALSSAAVLAIYGAGYARTREAADRFTQQSAERRSRGPALTEGVAAESRDLAAAAPDAPVPESNTPAETLVPPRESEASASAPIATPADAVPPAPSSANNVASPVPAESPQLPAPADASPPPAEVPAQTAAAPPVTPVAPAPSPAPTPAPVSPDPAKAAYKDGTYYGWGTSRHGDIQAEVVIEEGRIVLARVEKCMTRWSCNWVSPIPPVILRKQATTYDYVSGATESSDAFQGAVADALAQAK